MIFMTREMQNARDTIEKMTFEGASKDKQKRVIDAHKESK